MTSASAMHFSPTGFARQGLSVVAASGHQLSTYCASAGLDPVLQALPAAVILLDQRGVVYQANPAAISMLGEPLVGEAWFSIISRCFSPRRHGLQLPCSRLPWPSSWQWRLPASWFVPQHGLAGGWPAAQPWLHALPPACFSS